MANLIATDEHTDAQGVKTITRLLDDGTYRVNGGASQPATPATLARVSGLVADANRTTLEQRVDAALATNAAFLATVPGRRTAIANAITSATAKAGNATLTQADLRLAFTMLAQVGQVLTAMNDQTESVTKQNTAIIRLQRNALDSTNGV